MLKPSSLADYWSKVIAIEVVVIGLAVSFGLAGIHKNWDALLIPILIVQTVIIYRMLRQTGRSTALILLVVLVGGIGPSIAVGNREFFLSQLIYFIPMIVAGWPSQKLKPKPHPRPVAD